MIERMRAALAALLPAGAFLKLDRGDALFVTDAPRFTASPDWGAAGFLCAVENGLAHLTPGPEWMDALVEMFPEPPDDLCASLRRFDGPPDAAALRLFAMGLKQLAGAARDPAYNKKLRQLAAVRLREHDARGGLYACGLVNHLIEKERTR